MSEQPNQQQQAQPAGQPPLIVFIGPSGHGKSTARKLFCELVPHFKGASCSDVVYALLSQHLGVTETELRATDKEELRPKLVEFGDYLCAARHDLELTKTATGPRPDLYRGPSALVRVLFHAGVRVVDGIRRRLELQEVRERMEWFGIRTLVIWIEDPRKPEIGGDNLSLTKDDAEWVILNDGTPAELREKIKAWIASVDGKPQAAKTPEPAPKPAPSPAEVVKKITTSKRKKS